MTAERKPNHALTALWVIAPVTVGLFGVSTEWALAHNPLAADEASAAAPSASQASAAQTALRSRLAAATARYDAKRQALIDIQQDLRRGAAQLAALQAASGGTAPPAGGSAPQAPPAQAVPPPAPAAPPVHTKTGAS